MQAGVSSPKPHLFTPSQDDINLSGDSGSEAADPKINETPTKPFKDQFSNLHTSINFKESLEKPKLSSLMSRKHMIEEVKFASHKKTREAFVD